MERTLEKRIRWLLAFVICGLVASGVTAIPLRSEVIWLTTVLGAGPDARPESHFGLMSWLLRVREALVATDRQYPFLVAGWARGIPFYWRVLDSLFGIGAAVPLLMCRRYILRLEHLRRGTAA